MIIAKNELLGSLRRTLQAGNRRFMLDKCYDFRVLGILQCHGGQRVIMSRGVYCGPSGRKLYYWMYLPALGSQRELSSLVNELDWDRLTDPQDMKRGALERIQRCRSYKNISSTSMTTTEGPEPSTERQEV